MKSKIQTIALSIASTLLVMEELGIDSWDPGTLIQIKTNERLNPTGSPDAYQNYRCVEFAQTAERYFLEERDLPKVITYDSFAGKTYVLRPV